MNPLNKKAMHYAFKSYLYKVLISIGIALFFYITSRSLFAAITIGIALILAGLRFFYMDYLAERSNLLKKRAVEAISASDKSAS